MTRRRHEARHHDRHPDQRDDRGSGLIEAVWLGLILLVPLVYVVLSVFAVQRGAFATTTAARAAGRAYALAPTDATGMVQARAAARAAYADQGLPGDDLTVDVTCTPAPGRCHQGGSVVTVVVSAEVPLPLVPPILGRRRDASVSLDARFVVPIGQYQEVADGG